MENHHFGDFANFAHLAQILVEIAPQHHHKWLCEYSDRQKVGSRCVLQAKVIDTTSGAVFGVRKTISKFQDFRFRGIFIENPMEN